MIDTGREDGFGGGSRRSDAISRAARGGFVVRFRFGMSSSVMVDEKLRGGRLLRCIDLAVTTEMSGLIIAERVDGKGRREHDALHTLDSMVFEGDATTALSTCYSNFFPLRLGFPRQLCGEA